MVQRDRLVVVSNRLPVVFRRTEEGWKTEPGAGGLVSALLPVLRHRGGTWIGWPGTDGSEDLNQALAETSGTAGYALQPVHLTAQEVDYFYHGFANEIIWPLFHDMQSLCNFEPIYWQVYCDVNRKYADAIMRSSSCGPDDFVWVHDYHLMNVAKELRAMGSNARIGFFLHIPFPPLDLFVTLPWRSQLIAALLQYDLVGFQTVRDRRNFVRCVRSLMGEVRIQGKGNVVVADIGNRQVRCGAFPISIDFEAFMRQAASAQVGAKAKELHSLLPDRRLVLGIDRLDYTKGIPNRLNAFYNLLTRFPQLREKISLIQVVVPSRVDIPEYGELKITIEQLVGRINGEFMRPGGWVPVWYVYGSLTRVELLAYYRAADIALITPLRDGMNLVAKEYCAASIEEDCVLILSEFAGAATQMRHGALLVNPFDIEGVADALKQAYDMNIRERRARMRRLRRSVREYDIFWWVDSFMHAAFTKDLRDFPPPDAHTAEAAEELLFSEGMPESPVLTNAF